MNLELQLELLDTVKELTKKLITYSIIGRADQKHLEKLELLRKISSDLWTDAYYMKYHPESYGLEKSLEKEKVKIKENMEKENA